MRLRMNKWRAAWLVLTLLWLAAIVSIVWPMFPTEALQEERARSNVRAANAPPPHIDCLSSNPSDCPSWPREKAPPTPVSMEAFRLMEEQAVQQARENTTLAQVSFVAEGVACWLIPAVVVYLLGLGCAWLGRSMRKA
jgi:hypothetical protein